MAKKSCAGVIAGGILCALLSGCGSSGGGGGGGTTPPPPPSFTVTLSPTSVTLSQGGAGQAVQFSVTAQNGFTGTVSVSPATLPAGVTASPASLSLTPSDPGIFTFSASSAALIAQQTVNLNASSGMLAVSASLGLTVTGAAVSDPLH
ncbi:MAG TPA: hypothetical protein VMU26_24020 [Candidatus Polarisedimenticolia bacterium]|nr:hypothetical protein [Candidatus Polarisedimenticolia bacterium]